MEQTQTVQQVINSVVQTVGVIAPLVAMGNFGVTEFAKKIGLASRWAGIFSYVVGFVISFIVMGITTHDFFSPLTILVGVIAAFVPAGLYSGVKAAATIE